ncbi:5-hydroxytryptamine receptor 3A-like isoform 2-T2 [Anomaloglossus baeobatrachus]|uniref:5-hydroxytryptamine receptor 3A-like isoform X2 n=1 Tax=Anomaloglossus baeobatrachus TaxID=238106 RepID=UPI003F501C30
MSLQGSSSCQNCSYKNVIENIKFPNPSVRPVLNWTDPTHVGVHMFIFNIINVDTREKTLTTIVELMMGWKNQFINWQPHDYCGISYLYLAKERFWRPDLYIYEMTETEDKSQPAVFSILYYNGVVLDFTMMRLVTSCDLNVYKFPFDKQNCNISLGSYIFQASEMIFKSYTADVSNISKASFKCKGDWNLVNATVIEDNYTTEGQIYSRVILQITMERIPQNYVVSFILPICFMVLLDMASMFIEMPKNDRLGFKISIVLGFSVLLLILNDILPLTDKPPLLGIFCILCMAAMVVSILESILMSHILMLSENKADVPCWVEIVFVKYLSRILCFNRLKDSDTETMPDPDANVKKAEAKFKNMLEKIESAATNEETEKVIQLKNLLLIIVVIQNLIDAKRKPKKFCTAWSITANVIDHLFFILYVLFEIALCISVALIWAH